MSDPRVEEYDQDFDEIDDQPKRPAVVTTIEDARVVAGFLKDHGGFGLVASVGEAVAEAILSEVTRARSQAYDTYQEKLHTIFDECRKAKLHLEMWKAWRLLCDEGHRVPLHLGNARPTEWCLVDMAQKALNEATRIDDRVPF